MNIATKFSLAVFVLANFVFIVDLGFAQGKPNLKTWIQQFNSKSGGKPAGIYAKKLVLVKGWRRKYHPRLVDVSSFNKAGFLRVVPSIQVKWAYKLNTWPGGKQTSPLSLPQRVSQAMILSDADSMIVFPKNSKKPWRYIHGAGASIDTNITAPSGGSRSAANIKNWLRKILGYQSIVLDSKGDYILVANLLEDFDGTPLQALALKNSINTLRFNEGKSEGIGILSYLEGRGNIAIFRVIFLERGVTKIPAGSKLILEKEE